MRLKADEMASLASTWHRNTTLTANQKQKLISSEETVPAKVREGRKKSGRKK